MVQFNHVTLPSGFPANWQLDPETGLESGSTLAQDIIDVFLRHIMFGFHPFLMSAAVSAPCVYLFNVTCKMVIFFNPTFLSQLLIGIFL